MGGKKKIKIVIIGVGSRDFGRKSVADVLSCKELESLDCELVLVDINEKSLERMHGLALRIKEYYKNPMGISMTTDRTRALPGADYIITSVARRRYELWEQDFRVPIAHGFRHALGENGGPGALFHALRSLELIMPICADVERLCPGALLLNYTNPEARVLTAILRLTKVKGLGLCHGVFSCRDRVSGILGRPEEEIDMVSGGMNHFYWMVKIADRKTGEDLYPELRRRIAETPSLVPPLVKYMLDVYGLITYPSDDHIGEYLAWGHDFTGIKWHYGQECRKVFVADQAHEDRMEPYLTGGKPIDEWVSSASGELAVPIICDIELDRGSWRAAVNLLNTGAYVENLPLDGVVEVPAKVDAKGVHPVSIGPLPESLAAFIRTQVSIQKLIADGFKARDRNLLLQALLLDPVINGAKEAGAMLDYMLDIQSEFIGGFK